MPYYPANPAIGQTVQTVSANTTAAATGTTQIPLDDTIPQITEGDEYITLAITPQNANNLLTISIVGFFACNTANRRVTMALFQDATANALAAGDYLYDTTDSEYSIPLIHSMTAGTTSATTFRIRAGTNAGGTITFNGRAGTRLFGAITKSAMTITETKV